MKLPLSWLSEFIEFPKTISVADIAAGFVKVGFEVESIDNPAEKIKGPLLVGKVLTIEELSGHKKPIRYVGLDCGVEKLDYLTIPVLGRFKVADGFYAFAGPQIGLLLSAKSKYKDETLDAKDGFKGTNISALFGAEYKFTDQLSLGASYNAGLTNIAKDTDGDGKLTTTGFSINLGFSF